MAKHNSTDVLDEVENTEPLQYEAEKPLIIRQEEFIAEDLGYLFRYNVVRDLFEYSDDNGDTWNDLKERQKISIRRAFKLSNKFKGKGEVPTVRMIDEIIDTDFMCPQFNPFEDFFTSNNWDGKDRITELMATVTIEDIKLSNFELKDVWALLFRRWLIASVACSMGENPNHVMLLFISEAHGTYKSTWLNNLTPPALRDYVHFGHINPHLTDNNTANIVAEKFICNIDDQLDSIFVKDFNAIKSIITAPFVNNRKSFRRDENKRIRRVNFVGSVNNTDIFRDSQDRRYLTFEIKKIDWTAAKQIDMNQLWLQVYDLYKNKKERYYFDKGDEAIIKEINMHYASVTTEQEYFLKLFEPCDKKSIDAKFYPPTEILSVIKKASGLNVFAQNLSVALKRLGLEKDKQRVSWQGATQSRDGYWLKELFKKEFDRIIVPETPPQQEDSEEINFDFKKLINKDHNAKN